MAIRDRVKRLWNAFRVSDEKDPYVYDIGPSYAIRPDRTKLRYTSERTILSSIYTRLSIDVAAVDLKHIKLDAEGRYVEDIDSGLQACLGYEANLDQAPRAFRQDIVLTLFDDGVSAIVPVDTVQDPETNEVFDIKTLRVGKIVQWYPRHVTTSLYNIETGNRQDITLPKRYVAIVENPLYSVMNEPNSTMQRLTRKLNLLDSVDEATGSGKLDLIIQLPYVIKSEARRQQAEQRRADIEFQLKGSEYGIAYTDGTEKITQLNRPAENNLLKQIEYLTSMLYGQLGLTEEIMNGTADEAAMLNYFNRTIEPILVAMTEAMQRAFLGRANTRKNERIKYFQNPFKLVPAKDLAEIADKFTRNEILTANEIRGLIGLKPSKDPKADKLINSNMPQQEDPPEETGTSSLERTSQNGS
jgi:Phage portal protein